MAIARGSRSLVTWKEEATFGVAPVGAWNTFPLNSETLDENINTVQGEDIRSDRSNPSLRGGNIATGGNIVSDFGPLRNLTFMKHVLAGSINTYAVATANIPAAVDSVAYRVGQYVKGTTTTLWECTTAGTASTGLTAALTGTTPITSGTAVFTFRGGAAAADSVAYTLKQIVTGTTNKKWVCVVAGTASTGLAAALIGTANVTNGTATFAYLCADILVTTAYKRGDVVLSSTGAFWTCTRGGTTAGSGFTTASLTGVGEVEIPAGSGSPLKFQYFGPSTQTLYRHVISPSVAWSTGGLSIVKSIKGGTSDMYVNFRGCRINSLELTIPQEGIVKSTWGILAADSTKLADLAAYNAIATSEVATGESPFTGFNCYVGLNDAVGNSPRPVREMNMTLTNQADESAYVVGSRFRVEIPEGIRKASGRLSTYFLDATEYDWFKNETTIAMNMSMVWNGRMVKLDFGEVKITGSGTPKISGSGLMMADFEWTAFQESGAYDVQVTALNESNLLPV